jgi:hypothetical protein
MRIENNILEISKVMFTNKQHWKFVTDEQKEQFFFIFNRYFSRRYIDFAQLLNDKSIDKSVGMDLWFNKMKNEPYPQWFWSKSKKSTKDEDSEFVSELKMINSFTDQEMKFILENYPQDIQEEINYLKLQKNGNTREKVVHSKGTK